MAVQGRAKYCRGKTALYNAALQKIILISNVQCAIIFVSMFSIFCENIGETGLCTKEVAQQLMAVIYVTYKNDGISTSILYRLVKSVLGGRQVEVGMG